MVVIDMEMPEYCHKCYMSKTFGVVNSYEDKSQNEKWIYCDLTKKHLRDFNLMKDEYPPRPAWCPLTDVQQRQEGCDNCKYKELAVLVCLEKELSKEK